MTTGDTISTIRHHDRPEARAENQSTTESKLPKSKSAHSARFTPWSVKGTEKFPFFHYRKLNRDSENSFRINDDKNERDTTINLYVMTNHNPQIEDPLSNITLLSRPAVTQ